MTTILDFVTTILDFVTTILDFVTTILDFVTTILDFVTTILDFVGCSRCLKLLSDFTLLPYLAVNPTTFIDLQFLVCQQKFHRKFYSSCLSTTVDVLLNYTPSTLLNNGKHDQFRNVQNTKHGRKNQHIRKSLPTKRQTQ